MSIHDAILLTINAVVLLIPVFLVKDLESERIYNVHRSLAKAFRSLCLTMLSAPFSRFRTILFGRFALLPPQSSYMALAKPGVVRPRGRAVQIIGRSVPRK